MPRGLGCLSAGGLVFLASAQPSADFHVFRCFCLSKRLVQCRTTKCSQLHKQQCLAGAPEGWAATKDYFYYILICRFLMY